MNKYKIIGTRLDKVINISGLEINVNTISWYVWNGFSMFDIEMLYPNVTKEIVLLSCLLQAVTTNVIWRKRWGKWAKMHKTSILSGNTNVSLPNNCMINLSFLRNSRGKDGEMFLFL